MVVRHGNRSDAGRAVTQTTRSEWADSSCSYKNAGKEAVASLVCPQIVGTEIAQVEMGHVLSHVRPQKTAGIRVERML